ncbi:Fpg/Nei family DNA glycosylase [Phytoactinopolyspora limicola]|uniref:Fpg/Nei family DNA glycosylase n=1 Tax=Phytoactinopolyspora limicola TaxID=2715536 RepID=UPI00140C9EE4|nr:Fpg/Nei family DNA glycosylase [Phytoactinopolyspora limicola]
MPEGHTIHRLARHLRSEFAGEPLSVSSPQGRFRDSAALLDGTVLETTDAHGKHLFLGFGGGAIRGVVHRWVHVHLGLYGKFRIVEGPAEPPWGEVRMRLATAAAHADLRGPTRCVVIEPGEKAAVHARLGADPVRGDDPSAALERIARSRSPVALLLMDQSVIAGVGNAYRAEVLFRSGLDPATPGRRVESETLRGIWADLVELMTVGVDTGRIDTVRPEHEPSAMGRPPRVDAHGGEVYVYRRAGQPCLVCGSEVRIREVAARNLFWCPKCQA